MVVKIMQSHKSMKGTLQYNQNKVVKESARILGAFGMDTASETFHDFENTFARYERMNIRTSDISFQMSINPDPDRPEEKFTDAEALSYARKLMEGLGYGEQPILVYEHHDIGRKHYHVVSIRTDSKGRKIKDNFQRKKLQSLMHKYAQEYHYTVGNQEKKIQRKKIDLGDMPHFNPKAADVKEQYMTIFNEALTYRFTTPLQFQTIMNNMGVNIEFTEGTKMEGNEMYLVFEGLDTDKDRISNRISEKYMGIEAYKILKERMDNNMVKRPLTDKEKAERSYARYRVDRTVAFCMEHARTMHHFERMLARSGIAVTLSRTGDGTVFGATFADRVSKAAYKGSELKKFFDMNSLKQLAGAGGTWETNEQAAFDKWKARKKAQRHEAHIQHNMDLAARQTPWDYVQPEKLTRKAFRAQEDISYIDSAMSALAVILATAIGIRPKDIRKATRKRGYTQKKKKS